MITMIGGELDLREQVLSTLQSLWVKPRAAARDHLVPPGKVPQIAEATLAAMSTRRFRIGKMPEGEEYERLLGRVEHWVRQGEAIRITLGYGPMKNPNSTPYSRADWADYFALCNLCAWHNKVQEVYPPGLRIKLVFDDSTARMVLRAPWRKMNSYIRSIRRLIGVLGYKTFIVGTLRQSYFAWLFHFGLYQWAALRLRSWEQNPANEPIMALQAEYARRNLAAPPGTSPDEHERLCQAAARRFRVYWEALQLSGLSRCGKSLIAMYLDGKQHHIPQQAALHLHSLGKGQMTQPWQGEGALCDNGHGELIPYVLTTARREKMAVNLVRHLNLVPLPGFDAIRVCKAKGFLG
jgi:hypothetical protein